MGRVADLIFSSGGDRVIGLLLEGGSWWRRRLVPYEEVAAIGPAAVMLRQPVVLDAADGRRLSRLRRTHASAIGLRVLTRDGRDLGIVHDVCFAGDSGQVTGYLLSGGPVDDWVAGRGFVPLEQIVRQPAGKDGETPALLLTTPV